MPWLDEVEHYLHGVWLLLLGRLDGLNWLDFSPRGFWRSWWAIVFCLPPMLLNWAGLRIYYLSTMPPGVSAGPTFIAKIVIIDFAGWIISYLALAAVMAVSSYGSLIGPMIIAVNWLSVPLQWLGIFASLALIFAPLNSDLYLSIVLVMLILSAIAHFMVIRQLADRKILPATAFLLALVVANLWSTSAIGDALGFTS